MLTSQSLPRLALLCLIAVAVSATQCHAQTKPDKAAEIESKQTKSNQSTLTTATAAPSQQFLMLAGDYSAENKGVSVVVMFDGKIVYENYRNSGSATTAWRLASGTKSFAGIAFLLAEKDGLLTLDEKVSNTITEWRGDALRQQITIRHLLHQNSGLTHRRRLRVSYGDAVTAKCATVPGAKFQYGPIHFAAMGEVLKRKLAAKKLGTIDQYLQKRLFNHIGVKIDSWKKDKGGNVYLSHGASLTAKNWIKFGEWLRTAKSGAKTILTVPELQVCEQGSKANPAYGLTFWLNRPVSQKLLKAIPLFQQTDLINQKRIPNDLYMAAGAGDQRLFIIRSKKLVIVRQAKGVLGAVFGFRSQYSDSEFLCRLLYGQDKNGQSLIKERTTLRAK